MDPLSETDPGGKDLILSNEAISLVRLALSNQRDLCYLCTESLTADLTKSKDVPACFTVPAACGTSCKDAEGMQPPLMRK